MHGIVSIHMRRDPDQRPRERLVVEADRPSASRAPVRGRGRRSARRCAAWPDRTAGRMDWSWSHHLSRDDARGCRREHSDSCLFESLLERLADAGRVGGVDPGDRRRPRPGERHGAHTGRRIGLQRLEQRRLRRAGTARAGRRPSTARRAPRRRSRARGRAARRGRRRPQPSRADTVAGSPPRERRGAAAARRDHRDGLERRAVREPPHPLHAARRTRSGTRRRRTPRRDCRRGRRARRPRRAARRSESGLPATTQPAA